ncbi:MAG: TldD/PmbA family protein [Eubacteriales bacterium]|nr:TldD/PmbA family protein [Eubacteriales bacterium]
MIKETTAEKILDYILSHGGDFGEVFCEQKLYTQMNMISQGREHFRPEAVSSGCEAGTGIRIFQGGASIYLYTNAEDEASLFGLLKEKWGKTPAAMDGNLQCGKACGNESGYAGEICGASLTGKASLLCRINRAGFAASERISRMRTRYIDMDQSVLIANTEGVMAHDRRVKTRLHITATAQDGNETQSSYTGPGAMRDFGFYQELNPERYAGKAAEDAVRMLHAVPCPTGRMPVVIANGFGGLFFHEACGHSLEASAAADGASEFSGKIGQQVAAPGLTLIDDGSMPDAWGSLHIDDEGIPTRKNVLIENGILRGFMTDRWNGKRLGLAPTGSARRQSYRFAPTSRMTNTYIMAGTDKLSDMIASIDRGIYVKSINAGSVNPPIGEFNFNTSETFLIEHGEITKPVHSATLIGTGGDILKRVEMIGDDYDIGQGFCYAGSGAIYIGAGQPSVKISEMTVGGDEA